jgi:hypothetical protein
MVALQRLLQCELYNDGGCQRDGHCAVARGVPARGAALQNYLFIYLFSYFMLHPALRVFEAKASSREKKCVFARERERE